MQKHGLKHIKGDPWTICDYCGFKVRKSFTKMDWMGFQACMNDWDPKHGQLYPVPAVRGEGRPYPNARPEPKDQFLSSPADNGFSFNGPPDENT